MDRRCYATKLIREPHKPSVDVVGVEIRVPRFKMFGRARIYMMDVFPETPKWAKVVRLQPTLVTIVEID